MATELLTPQEDPLKDSLRNLVKLDLEQFDMDKLRELVRQDLRSTGYEVIGEIPERQIAKAKRDRFVGPPELMPERITAKPSVTEFREKGVQAYLDEPSFWKKIKNISTQVAKGELEPFGALAGRLLKGVTLGNVDAPEFIEKISGRPGFAEDARRTIREQYPGFEEVEPILGVPAELAGSLLTLSGILRGAGKVAAKATDVPVLKGLATAEITGITTGLLRKPEEEGFLNRLKQVPGDVLFFTVFEAGLLTAEQLVKIYRWNKAFKHYKGVKWGTWTDIPAVPGAVKVSAKDMRTLWSKMQRNSVGAKIPLTEVEKDILEALKENNGWRKAIREGFLHKGKAGIPTATYAEVAPIPRQPKFADIFKREAGLPKFEEVGKVKFPEQEVRVEPEVVRPEAEPVRPKTPPGIPPERGGVPAVVVDVNPNPKGGWTYEFKIPTEKIVPPRELPPTEVKPTPPKGVPTAEETLKKMGLEPPVKKFRFGEEVIKPKGAPKIKTDEELGLEKISVTEPTPRREPPKLRKDYPEEYRRKYVEEAEKAEAEKERVYDIDIVDGAFRRIGYGGELKSYHRQHLNLYGLTDKEINERIAEAKRPIEREVVEEEIAKIRPEPEWFTEVKDDLEPWFRSWGVKSGQIGKAYDRVREHFDPTKAEKKLSLKDQIRNYILKQVKPIGKKEAFISPETGEMAVKPEKMTKVISEKAVEEQVPYKKAKVDRFAEAEEEERVVRIIRDTTGGKEREQDILESRLLRTTPESFESIGKRHNITRQSVHQIYKKEFEKVKNHPDVQEIIKKRMTAANLGPIPTKRDLKRLALAINKIFSSRKGASETIDLANDRRVAARKAEIFLATHEAKELRKFINKQDNDAVDGLVYDVLTGQIQPEDTYFPDDIKDLLKHMRGRVDALSELIMTHGGLSEQTKATFEINIGRYIRKFYKLHQQKRWNPTEEVRERFKAALKRDEPDKFGDFTNEEMDEFLEAMIEAEKKGQFSPQMARVRVDPTLFKRRKVLSKEWKEFAGEILDPTWLYIKTITHQAAASFNAKFLNKVKEIHPNLWTDDEKLASRRGWQENQLPKTYAYGELAGKYIHPELYKYITRELKIVPSEFEKVIGRFIVYPFKATKTIGSIPTQARNFLSNVPLSGIARNSILNPANLPYYMKAVEVFVLRNKTRKKEWTELIKAGVTDTQFYGEEIPRFASGLLKLDPVLWPEKIYNYSIKAGIEKAGNLYNFEDVFYRIASHYKNIDHFKMSVEESVTEINRSFQNYRKLPLVVDFLRRYTFFGPFISFKWNIGKIIGNQSKQAFKEMGSKNEKTKMKGIMRAIRLAFYLALPAIASEVSKKIYNIDKEEMKDLEKHYPDYRRHGRYIYFRGKDEQLKAFDLTYMYPTGDLERASRALLRGDMTSFTNAIDLFTHPIFDAWSILVQGRQPYWQYKIRGPFMNRVYEFIKTIWTPASAPIPSFKALLKGEIRAGKLTPHQIEVILDAYYQQPDRYGRIRKLPEEVKNFFTGIRTWDVNPKELLGQRLNQIRAEIMDEIPALRGWLIRNTKTADWEKLDQMKEVTDTIKPLIKEAQEINDLIRRLEKGFYKLEKKK